MLTHKIVVYKKSPNQGITDSLIVNHVSDFVSYSHNKDTLFAKPQKYEMMDG